MKSLDSGRLRRRYVPSGGHDARSCLPGRPDPARAALRHQLAVVRALVDEVARTQPLTTEGGPNAQLVEELARLGCRCLELAEATSRLIEPGDEIAPAPRSHVRRVVPVVP